MNRITTPTRTSVLPPVNHSRMAFQTGDSGGGGARRRVSPDDAGSVLREVAAEEGCQALCAGRRSNWRCRRARCCLRPTRRRCCSDCGARYGRAHAARRDRFIPPRILIERLDIASRIRAFDNVWRTRLRRAPLAQLGQLALHLASSASKRRELSERISGDTADYSPVELDRAACERGSDEGSQNDQRDAHRCLVYCSSSSRAVAPHLYREGTCP